MLQRAALGREKVLGPGRPHIVRVVNCLRQLNVGVKRNENQNSSVDQGLPKERTVRENGGNGKD